jgi:succinate dehydrogenase/fumarate reductase flavoprotein subunit
MNESRETPQNLEGKRFATVEEYEEALKKIGERRNRLKELKEELKEKYGYHGLSENIKDACWKKRRELDDEQSEITKRKLRVLVEALEVEEGEEILASKEAIEKIEEI